MDRGACRATVVGVTKSNEEIYQAVIQTNLMHQAKNDCLEYLQLNSMSVLLEKIL